MAPALLSVEIRSISDLEKTPPLAPDETPRDRTAKYITKNELVWEALQYEVDIKKAQEFGVTHLELTFFDKARRDKIVATLAQASGEKPSEPDPGIIRVVLRERERRLIAAVRAAMEPIAEMSDPRHWSHVLTELRAAADDLEKEVNL